MKNKNLLIGLFSLTILLFTGCSKDYYDTKIAGEDFLAANKKNDAEVVELSPSKIQYKVIFNNQYGDYPQFTEAYNLTIRVKYSVKFIDGSDYIAETGSIETIIISTASESFWSVIIPKMRIGSKWRVWVPYDYAYKDAGLNKKADGSYDIDPYTVLVYDVELIDAN